MSAPVIPAAAPDGVLRGGYDTGGFYDEVFEIGPDGDARPRAALRRGSSPRSRRWTAGTCAAPPSSRTARSCTGGVTFTVYSDDAPARRADPAVRPDPAHPPGRGVGGRRGRAAAADRGAEPLRARHLPRPGRSCTTASCPRRLVVLARHFRREVVGDRRARRPVPARRRQRPDPRRRRPLDGARGQRCAPRAASPTCSSNRQIMTRTFPDWFADARRAPRRLLRGPAARQPARAVAAARRRGRRRRARRSSS